MSVKFKEKAEGKISMDRRIIQVENLPDQAGITAALRRAFAARAEPAPCQSDDDLFAALLKQIH